MSYSFRAPFVDGKIWHPTEGSIDLTLVGENKLPYSNGVEIVLKRGGMMEITVHLSPTRDEAIRLIDEEPWIRLGNTIGVRWGYNDGNPAHISDWFYGFMILPEVTFGEEITVDLKANGAGWKLSTWESTRVWGSIDQPRTLRDVFDEIAQKYGLTVKWQIEPEQDAYFDTSGSWVQAGLTDFQFIERYARHCAVENQGSSPVDMVVRGNELIMISVPKITTPIAEFHYYGKPDPANNIFVMDSFTPESFGALFLPHRTYSTILWGPNSDPIENVKKIDSAGGVAPDGDKASAGRENAFSGEDSLQTPGTDIPPADPKLKMKTDVAQDLLMDAGKHVPIIIDEKTSEQMAKAQLDNIRQQDAGDFGISVTYDAYGLPILVPEHVVRLRGVTKFFSTDYRINELTFTIGDGGANMTVNAWAQGLAPELALFSQQALLSQQGSTEPGDGGEDVQPDTNAGQ